MPDEQKQICVIRIMFPVDTDEQAINCKKQVSNSIAELKDVQIHFSLMPAVMPIRQSQDV